MKNKMRMPFQLTTLLLFLVMVITACSPAGKTDSSGEQAGAVSSGGESAALQDGTYVPETFTAQGGTGKVKITCPEVTLTQGEAQAVIEFSSPHYEWVKVNGQQYAGDFTMTEGGGSVKGLGLLPLKTVFLPQKTRKKTLVKIEDGFLAGCTASGYEIHMGMTESVRDMNEINDINASPETGSRPACHTDPLPDHIWGTYLHGLFDRGEIVEQLAAYLCGRRHLDCSGEHVRSGRTWILPPFTASWTFDRLMLSVRAAGHGSGHRQVYNKNRSELP